MRAKILHRRRVSSLLEGMFETPLFLVVSAMGYGKTTAVRGFLTSKRHVRHVWLSLRPGESDEQWTWQRLCVSLCHLDEERARRLAGFGLPKGPADLDRATAILAEMVSGCTVVVVDDYHENRSEALDFFFSALARAAIPNLHTVIISRTYPRIPVDEFMLKGLCGELAQTDLEFTEDETARFFSLNGFDLPQQELAAVSKITDGWTAAVYLTLLKYARDGSIDDTRGIARLIRTAVFDGFDADTQRILLQLSLLDSFTIQGAVAVTGDKRAGDVIRSLADNNCFIRYEPRSGTYELHSILRDALEEVFPASKADTVALLNRCGDWSAERGEFIQAIDFYAKAGAHDRILDVYELAGAGGLIDNAPGIIIGAFSRIDLELKLSRPLAYLTYIYSYLIAVDLIEGGKMLSEAKAHYESSDEMPDKRRILGEIALIESFLYFNDVYHMIEYHKKAHSQLDGGRSLIAKREGIFTFGSPHTLYLYHKEPGGLSRLVDCLETEIKYYVHMSDGCGTGYEHLARAEYLLETGDLQNAEVFSREAILKAKSRDQVSLIICAGMCLARLAILGGRPEQACGVLDELRAQVEATGSRVLVNGLDVATGYVNGVLGKAGGIPEWLLDVGLARNEIYYQSMGTSYIVTAKAALLNARYAEAEAIVETMRGLYEANNHIFGFIHAGIIDAAAKRHLYGSDRAVQVLRETIELARQDGIVTPFAESAPELGSILAVAAKSADDGWTRKVMRLWERVAACRELLGTSTGTVPLTPRETEVLSLLEQGLKQEEIARRLHLSPNTVSRHLQNAYGKLGVHNKTQALNKAGTLRLI